MAEASRRHDVTVYAWLLTTFLTTLHKYSGQRDLVVGTPVAGRHHPDVDRLVGFFVNTVPVRSRHRDHDTFEDFLRRVSATCLGALDHQDVPFEQIVQRLGLQGVTSHAPLVQTVFAYQEGRTSPSASTGWRPNRPGRPVRPRAST